MTSFREDSLSTTVLPDSTAVPPVTEPRPDKARHSRRSPASRWTSVAPDWLVRYWKPLTMLVAARIVMLGVVLASKKVHAPIVGGITAGHHFDRLAAWDGGWYLRAAQFGWPTAVPMAHGAPAYSTLAFFPAFPLAIRAVALSGIGWIASGVLTALIFQIVMVILLWQLIKEIWGESVSDRGLMLFLFGPGAVAFALIYSEAMLFAASAACLLALRRRWWVVAGVSAAIGTAVRPVGIALVACCAWEAIRVVRSERQWRPLIAPLLSPLGIVAWFGYLWAHTGNPFIWSKAEKAWDDSFDPFTLIKRYFFHELGPHGVPLEKGLPLAGAVFCLIALVLLIKAKPPATLLIYSVVVIAISASSRTVSLRPRLVETAFPLVIVVGYWLKGNLYSIVLACAGMALGAYLLLTLISPNFIP